MDDGQILDGNKTIASVAYLIKKAACYWINIFCILI